MYFLQSLFQCKGQWPASYRIEREQKKKESFLDPNHTHFILCDNGTEHKFAVEIPFRAKLENELAKIKTDTGEGKNNVFNSLTTSDENS